MATGDVTVTLVGVFRDTTIAAGVTGQNLGTQYVSGANLVYVPLFNGQVMVLKEARAI